MDWDCQSEGFANGEDGQEERRDHGAFDDSEAVLLIVGVRDLSLLEGGLPIDRVICSLAACCRRRRPVHFSTRQTVRRGSERDWVEFCRK